MKKIMFATSAALLVTGSVPVTVVDAAPASACVWDANWFFNHQCSAPPPAAPLPPEQQQASHENPNGIPWKWWDNSGEHVCPPECLS